MEGACKKCKAITNQKICPVCGSREISQNWKGLFIVFDPEKSEIAKKINITTKGKYALKVR